MDVINDVGAAKAASASDTLRPVLVDVATPVGFEACFHHVIRGPRVLSIGVAVSPTSLSLSVEILAGRTKGLAIGLGPVWIFLTMTTVRL
ncbi:hypothetical protein ASE75_06130 [Sphingomonas sp. Leaf17]|uniref:hypothetical protein n=1 Tax=Sphingomonas sp. Leaf17 TaxID=1735683 RepID=UPI0007001824|nr:hypothetical protein [Sphingomonas sp. Leaf17]KQM65805.1 hypothetical protein ASE75_06130 [Sphingomonas sp. Leaf17]